MEQGKITLTDEDGSEIEFYILEQTELSGNTYLLVTDGEDEEDAVALILREKTDEDGIALYETVEDETELSALSKVFSELLGDVDFEIESE